MQNYCVGVPFSFTPSREITSLCSDAPKKGLPGGTPGNPVIMLVI